MVYWSPQRVADEYDLEWTYVDSAALDNYKKSGDPSHFDPKKIFPGNATRVSLAKERYLIPLLFEGSGTLFFRVRAVQVKQNGQRIESVWSSDYSTGLGEYNFRGHDTTLNWQASTSFAEEGKRKSVVQYFDGSLKSRQTVTKDNTTDTTIIAETFYDNQGRAVIQVMPAPSLSSMIKYTPAFNQLNGAEYAKDAYDGLLADTCKCRQGAPVMDTDKGAARYYSPNNPMAASSYHKYIPDAKGFAFAETRYTPDNTGRISIQGGVADTFQIGRRHETIYTYNAADQEELDALFGTEAGNSSHYFKNTVQDANGQVSISYVDMHGRTIATALAGKPLTKLDTLAAKKSIWITKKLLDSNSNVVKGMVIESSKGLVVTETGDHHFKYSLLPDSVRITDCHDSTICYDCIYDLEITISEECNDTSKLVGNPIIITRTNNHIDNICDSLAHLPVVDTTLVLPVGSYLVTKKLTINRQAMDYYRDSIFLVRNSCHTLEQIIQQQKELLRTAISCETVCDSCDNLGLQRDIRQQMLADVTPPFGQYANPDSIDQFSVFWTSGIDPEPAYKIVSGDYTDGNGISDPLHPKTLNQASFVNEFKSSWAETLLLLHPEYPKLLKLEQLAASNNWDVRFQNTPTFQAAVDSGFLNPGDFATHPAGSNFNYIAAHGDPLFGMIADSFKVHMQDSLLEKAHDTSNNAISMWSLATIMAHCPDRDNSCLYRYKSMDSAFAIGAGCSADQDIAWQYFREMYLQEKREIITQVLNEAQRQPGNRFPDLKELVDNHTPNFFDPAMPPPHLEDMPDGEARGQDSLNTFINDNCTAYVNQWWQELKPCDLNTDDSLWIMPKLIEVCRQGGDAEHLFGASTVKPTSTYTYRSFEEVIKAYRTITGKSYDATCNVYLISAPLPYDQQPVYYDKPVYQKPDSCECTTIGELYNQYQAANKDSSFSDYLYRTTGARIYQGVLDTLRMACSGQINCSFLKEPVTLPPVLQCGVKEVCAGCQQVNTLYKRYIAEFPNAIPQYDDTDSLQHVRNQLFGQYMNTHLGFGKSTTEYLAFMDICEITRGAQVYNSNEDSILLYVKNEFLNEYFNYGRKYDSDGSDTNTIKFDFHGSINNTGVPHKDIIRNGLMQYPDTLIPARPHGFVDMDLVRSRDSACIGGYMNMQIRMKDSIGSWETNHGFVLDLGFSTSGNKRYYINFDHFDTHWNYIQAIGGSALVFDLAGFQQNFNGWHTLNFEVVDSLVKFYYDGDLKQTVTFPGVFRERFYGYTFEPRADSNLAPQVDYIKCYDRNGKVFYFEDFNDRTSPSVFEQYIQCPRQPCTTAFTAYYNQQRQTSYSWLQLDSIYGVHNISLRFCDSTNLTLCGKTGPVFAPVVVPQHAACDDTTLFANSTGTLIQDAYRDSLINSFNDRYLAKCLSARYHETFTLEQRISEYHYTLYYYDQAGNLLKTIPPAGVDVSKFAWASAWRDSVTTARRNRQWLTPHHTQPTQYRYNTLNQVVAQQSPDGGLSEFWYDRLGRLVVSRNARQKGASASEEGRLYSYTQYDTLGRITEVGQVSNTSGNGAMTDAISRDPNLLSSWLLTLTNRRGQITNTVYDLPYPFDGGDPRQVIEQKNLRNRVSYTTITDTGTSNAFNQGTFYTYDILGNVDHLLQDYGHSGYKPNVMNKLGNRWKKVSYQYDLISGKVNMVMYQHDWDDGFFHRYSYDAENRLTLVETSRDSLIWEKDARYEYYRHGPLARVTLGDQQVQGIDYAYTLQGWLKGINSTSGTDSFDMGGDGRTSSLNRYTARDAIGLTLNYFANDYTAINGQPFPGYSAYLPSGAYRPLYNGNISSSSVYQKKFDYDNSPGGPLIFYNYRYDQLNRLTGQDAYNGFSADSNSWKNIAVMGENLKERITYDGNGNILKYLRKSIEGADAFMDSLNYFYYSGTNKLRRITDSIPANTYTSKQDNLILDIDGQLDSNYCYDAIGNLIKDRLEQITSIKWNVYGKIQEINRVATTEVPVTNIKYSYDALGNRISQIVTTTDNKYYTWYVRDAQGNILSTYTAEGDDEDLENLPFKHAENFLYGSSRLGSMAVGEPMTGSPSPMQYYYHNKYYGRGYKQYELTNHLGNVLATVSDRKFGVSSGGSSLIDYYEPDIVTAQDYYPFGMMSRVALPNNDVPYKFGFNGKMNDNEVKGLGNQIDYGARISDPRTGGRFFSIDPLARTFPYYSPYQFSGNNPIRYIDLDGAEQFDPQSVPKGVAHLSMATAPGVVQQTKSVQIGNYELRGVVGENGEAYWIARYHYKEGRFKGMYNDEWVVGTDGVKVLAKDPEGYHNRSEWIGEFGGKPFNVKSIVSGWKEIVSNPVNWVAGAGIFAGSFGSITKLKPSLIRFSQRTVNGAVLEDVAESMKANGWKGEAIDVVKMEDGIYTSFDNKRLLSAKSTETDVIAIVHDYTETLDDAMKQRIKGQYGVDAETWGDAVKLRVKNQGKKFSTANPNGSFDLPEAKSKKQ
ncbi:hypothetical protein A4H97_24270 [Niastella yeongjuensis]|uniref:Uncharacterized protein n=1 Tax=Niastella yeongjuensis TaxID=354355 RepID=A0A1V9F368_9BACT|nr:RHS repeat-associated core domain-containing protein [Niastella yeongjuensis]OQP52818.1 hypothetical protein A4H97_24270 [Niastella yeongjuensis]SEP20465.1 Uncharacterized conserved protein RhaS, contains 28 RHS repeats [Niastella yeongjuensis]